MISSTEDFTCSLGRWFPGNFNFLVMPNYRSECTLKVLVHSITLSPFWSHVTLKLRVMIYLNAEQRRAKEKTRRMMIHSGPPKLRCNTTRQGSPDLSVDSSKGCVCVCVYTHIYTNIYIYTYTHTNIYVHLYVYAYVYAPVSACVYSS